MKNPFDPDSGHPRRVPLYVASGFLVIALAVGVPLVGVPVFGYLDGSAEQFFVSLVICYVAVAFGLVAGYFAVRSGWVLVAEALEHPESEASAVAGWNAAVSYPRRGLLAGSVVTAAISVPTILAYWIPQFGLNVVETIGAAAGGLTGFAAGCAFQLTALELALRPIVARIAEGLPPDQVQSAPHSRVLVRLMLAFAVLAGTTGIVSGLFIPDDADAATQLAVAVGAAIGSAVLIAVAAVVVLAAVVEVPLRQLAAGTARVARGEFTTPIPPTTSDEFGALISSFNRMQRGLIERERLAGENVELQDQVREQLEQVRASRARIVSASDAERRRVERNLHDGAQQRLVSLALKLSLLESQAEPRSEQADGIAAVKTELSAALSELRDLARGLHPQVLSAGGLKPALEQLAARSPVPVEVRTPADRYSDAIESTAYFVISEALANVAKYAQASRATVTVERRNGLLVLAVEDDGVGGADLGAASGLAGLHDRVSALDGRLTLKSPAGAGTKVFAELPLPS